VASKKCHDYHLWGKSLFQDLVVLEGADLQPEQIWSQLAGISSLQREGPRAEDQSEDIGDLS
jgi:hypothetical protein